MWPPVSGSRVSVKEAMLWMMASWASASSRVRCLLFLSSRQNLSRLNEEKLVNNANTGRTGDKRAFVVLNDKTDKAQSPIVPPQTVTKVSSALLRLKIRVNAI